MSDEITDDMMVSIRDALEQIADILQRKFKLTRRNDEAYDQLIASLTEFDELFES